MRTRRELAQEQLNLMDDIRANANINIVTCGHCGTILLHKRNEEDIECFSCKNVLDQSDCPDLWYEGCQNNSEFDEDKPTEELTSEISFEDVVRVATELGLNPTIAEINEVLKNYDSEAQNDTTATWDLIVENLLYKNLDK